jgi:hypothetical protein
MAIGFFKNYRVYILTTVAYMGSLLFGKPIYALLNSSSRESNLRFLKQDMTLV